MLNQTLSKQRQTKRELAKQQNAHLLEEKRNAMCRRQQEIETKLAERNEVLQPLSTGICRKATDCSYWPKKGS